MALLERDELLRLLHAAQEFARAGEGRFVVVDGEAGSGKTALVTAAFGAEAHWGFCEPLSTPRPLGPFRDAARTLWPGGTFDPATIREELLERLAAEPTVVVVEDVHWVDDASVDVLRFLARRVQTTPSLVVVTLRDELDRDHRLLSLLGELATSAAAERVTVPALSRGAVAELAGEDLDADAVHRATRGNAFLVSQWVQSGGGAVPTSVQDVIHARVLVLSTAARDLVELAAVMPGRTPLTLLDPGPAALDGAVVRGLLRCDGPFVEFRHELVRQAVVAGLPPGSERARHAEALARLMATDGPEPAAVAFHAHGAGDAAVAYAADVEAAGVAAESSAHRETARHLALALENLPHAEPIETRVELLVRLAVARQLCGDDAAALEAAEDALALCPPASDPALRGMVLRAASRIVPDMATAFAYGAEAITLLEPLGPGVELARARAVRAMCLMVARELDDARGVAAQAVQDARATGDPFAQALGLMALGCVDVLTGEDPTAEHLRAAINVAQDADLPVELGLAHANLVSAAGEARLYTLAEGAGRDALAYFVSRDVDSHAQYVRAWRARCLFEQGQWSDAARMADEILDAGGTVRDIAAIVAHVVRGRIRARRGDPDVWGPLDEARRLAVQTGALQRLAPVAVARAEARWLEGRPDDGTDGLASAHDFALELGVDSFVGELGFWMWRHGLLERLPDSAYEPYRLQTAGRTAEAAVLWESVGCPYERADALVDSEDVDDARTALDLFTTLGAAPARQRAARILRSRGVLSIPRGPRTTTSANPDGLTRREAEVLDWLRRGFTDAEIAERLFLSPKTVQHHVSAVLRKTGAGSRRDLRERVEP